MSGFVQDDAKIIDKSNETAGNLNIELKSPGINNIIKIESSGHSRSIYISPKFNREDHRESPMKSTWKHGHNQDFNKDKNRSTE
jgi:hypothetical protein